MNAHPLDIFVASASEGLDVANAVRDALGRNTRLRPRLWNEGTFKPSMTFIEAIEGELNRCDFAVLTLTPDDWLTSRGHVSMAPRDNVLFELGLFMGRLGRERTYFVCDKNENVKIPTDLLGVNPATFERLEGHTIEEALAPVCASLANRMTELDVRLKTTPESEVQARLVSRFCDRIRGSWWGRQWSDGETRLALLRITNEGELSTVRVDGDTFDSKGQLFGHWQSVAAGIRAGERKLFYSWEGTHPAIAPGESFKGFGEYTFTDASGMLDHGEGLFADIHVGRKKAAIWKSVELRRVDAADLNRVTQVMKIGTDSARAAEVISALGRFIGLGASGT
jgi:hypothetical protein